MVTQLEKSMSEMQNAFSDRHFSFKKTIESSELDALGLVATCCRQ